MHTTRLKTWLATGLVGLMSVGFAVVRVEAHHSFAMYDAEAERTMTGKLVRFIIGSNHSQFIFDLVDDQGESLMDADGDPVQWGVETGPAVSLARQGITVDSFPIDSIFTVTLYPLRNGKPFGAMRGALVICGDAMPEGGCTEETGTAYGR
jgi:hypothetical protein